MPATAGRPEFWANAIYSMIVLVATDGVNRNELLCTVPALLVISVLAVMDTFPIGLTELTPP